jgi:hypothetical protein
MINGSCRFKNPLSSTHISDRIVDSLIRRLMNQNEEQSYTKPTPISKLYPDWVRRAGHFDYRFYCNLTNPALFVGRLKSDKPHIGGVFKRSAYVLVSISRL